MHFRIKDLGRATLKWLGAALCVAILSGGVLSMWFHAMWNSARDSQGRYQFGGPHLLLQVSDGGFTVRAWTDEDSSSGSFWPLYPLSWGRTKDAPQWRLWFTHQRAGGKVHDWRLFVPFWAPLIPCGWLTALVWKRRAAADECASCRYSRVGLPEGTPCPECGAEPRAVLAGR